MATENSKVKEWNEAYKHAIVVWGPWLDEAEKDLEYFLGKQWKPSEEKYLASEKREALVFNRIRRVVHLIEGFQRKNRLALKIDPWEGGDDRTAKDFSEGVMWVMQHENGYNVMSDAFGGMLRTGMNLVNPYIVYDQDLLNGDIRFKRIPYNRFLVDPNFQDRLFRDAGYLLRREYLTKEAVKALLPGRGGDIDRIEAKGRDDKYPQYYPSKDLQGKPLYRWDEMYLRKSRPVKVLVDPRTGQQRTWRGDDERLKLFLHDYPFIQAVDRYESYIELSIIVEEILFSSGEEPNHLTNFPFIPVVGFYDPEYKDMKLKLQGIVRCMRDPQTESNKRRCKMLDILDSMINAGDVWEENALVDPKQVFKTGQGRHIFVKEGSLGRGAYQQIPPPHIPEGLFRLQEIMDKDVDEIPGANAELFGTPENPDLQIAGFLAKLRSAAGITILQDIFDNYRLSKKELGNMIMNFIRENWTPHKVKRIIARDPSQQFYDRSFGIYDAVPQEGILTDTQRHMFHTQLLSYKQLGAPIPWAVIIDNAPIEKRDELKKAIAEEEKRQAQAAQVEVMDRRLTQGMMRSKIAADVAKAEENRAQAIENMANATYDRMRTLGEVQKLGIENVISLVDWIRGMEKGEEVAPAAKAPSRKMTRR